MNRVTSLPAALAVSTLVAAVALSEGLVNGQETNSAVADAVKQKDNEALRALIENGVDVNSTQGDGATALHWATYYNDFNTVKFLLDAGANIDAKNDLGVSPLWLACNNGSSVLVRTLLDSGADPNTTLPSGETSLMTASRTGNVTVVRSLIEYGAEVNKREYTHGQTALMWAVSQQHPSVVKVLLQNGARVEDRSNVYPQVISSSGNADPSGVYEIEQGGYTALLFASRHGNIESAQLLVNFGANVNDVAPMGTSALVISAHSGHTALSIFLLEEGADPNATGSGYNALHAAVLRGDLTLVKSLLSHGAEPNAKLSRGTPARRVSNDWRLGHNMIGATPFWLAARFREPEIMHALIEGGANPLVVKDQTNALLAALQGGTSRGRTFISNLEQVTKSEEQQRMTSAVELALDSGADINAADEDGNTALHVAASRRLDHIISLLAHHGAILDVRNGQGQTPLGLAQSGPRGLAALYNPSDGSISTETVLRELGAMDEGASRADP